MTSKYDYLIVGAGLYGSCFARLMTDAGKRCVVIDKRPHIAGNCYTRQQHDIHVHQYGPHIFHTNNKKIWEFITKFGEFNQYIYRPKVEYNKQLFSFPINLFTLYQIWNLSTPAAALKKIESERVTIERPNNFEEAALATIGQKLYSMFIYGYTKKQWGTEPKNLPAHIFRRLPIRYTFEDNYFTDQYQGIPSLGYTALVAKMLEGIEVYLNTDFHTTLWQNKPIADHAKKILWTGGLDDLHKYYLGRLPYRSLHFDHLIINTMEDVGTDLLQGTAVINHTNETTPYTRTIEHKHFCYQKGNPFSIYSYETPKEYGKKDIPFYPIEIQANKNLHTSYVNFTHQRLPKVIFGGRLAEYRYYDMHQIIGAAMLLAQTEILHAN